jgi:three-Cys-motif partner protein
MPPKTVRWKRPAQTAAKHQLLRGYLNAWLPIMGRSGGSMLIVDGFAGPGTYEDGEPGSPLVMLQTFLDHDDRANWTEAKFAFAFIEKDGPRVAALEREVAKVRLPSNASLQVVHGEFDREIGEVLDTMPQGYALPPSFIFIDPFGWTGHGLELSSRILEFPKCEVLVYVPFPWIARFVDDNNVRGSLDNLFGDDGWLPARKLEDGRDRVQFLHDLFLERLASYAGLARSFEFRISGRGWNGYHLFFGTGHLTGLDRMKRAMWRLDPVAGAKFADSTGGQLTLFDQSPDLSPLRAAIEENFRHREFTIEEAERFTLLETPYHPKMHLKKGVLKSLEEEGILHARHRTKARTYPPRTVLRLDRR